MGLFLLDVGHKGRQQGMDIHGLFQLEVELILLQIVHRRQIAQNGTQVAGIRNGLVITIRVSPIGMN